MQAAKAMLDQMVDEKDSLKWSQWTEKTVKAAIRRKNNTALKKTGPLVMRHTDFVHSKKADCMMLAMITQALL